MLMKILLTRKKTDAEDKKEKAAVFFRKTMDVHMNMDRLRRTITNNLIDNYFESRKRADEKRLIGWGDNAVPKLYLLSRDWKDVELSMRVIRILKRMNTPLADTAVSLISPDMDYNAYFILDRKDALPVLEKKKKEKDVTNVYIFSPDKCKDNQ